VPTASGKPEFKLLLRIGTAWKPKNQIVTKGIHSAVKYVER